MPAIYFTNSLEIEEPKKPEEFEEGDKEKIRERAIYLSRMKEILTLKRNNHGERCAVNYKLEVARAVSCCPLHGFQI